MVSCFKIIWKGIVCMKITKVFWFVTWLVVSIPLKNMKVSWDDEIPNIWKVIKFMFQTTNQRLLTSINHY